MPTLFVEPDKICQFKPNVNQHFCVLTSPEMRNFFSIRSTSQYLKTSVVAIPSTADLSTFINDNIPTSSDILYLIPEAFKLGYQNPHLCLLPHSMANKRMVVMRCLSTPATFAEQQSMISDLYSADMPHQRRLIDQLYKLGEPSPYLQITDSEYTSTATFNHLSDDYSWHSLIGTPEQGQFVLGPSGETNAIVTKISTPQIKLDISGTITLKGVPIVHHGNGADQSDKQQEIYTALNGLRESALEATVEQGRIQTLRSTNNNPASQTTLRTFEALFKENESYRDILELGFGLHPSMKPSSGNLGTNEFYGGPNGTIHYGLGRVPHTEFHIDIVCPNARLQTDQNVLIFGQQ